MHGIFTYILLIFVVNVGKYNIHGCYGGWKPGAFFISSPNKNMLCFHTLVTVPKFLQGLFEYFRDDLPKICHDYISGQMK